MNQAQATDSYFRFNALSSHFAMVKTVIAEDNAMAWRPFLFLISNPAPRRSARRGKLKLVSNA
ncbi:hypothetical protein CEW81_14500 [Kluyvera genomosp. 3]|uniref:Uncharacterized protein n=1 Tax=Kluyvera genomosp. 3 TaxID=2774055 RepID=A0A248KJN5_9ENTR|nr:hypothetical protein CEW81_14500 [Kluyvera genomosp. 3]